MRRAGILLLASVAVVGALFVGGAAGHKAKYGSMVTAKFKQGGSGEYTQPARFEGSVNSRKPRCEKDRRVKVHLRAPDGSTPVVGTGVTDGAGAWVVSQPPAPAAGTYYAEVTKKVLRKNAKHRHICRKAISKDIKVK